ncbi:hypothetical protein JKF63_00685 [Porcisia hertigi]|uniref:Uncharacterized protein n=1 Tax=Porcisia hertigi TaxID=2761500 RepID=A0A836L199_9TRYP|nr:hypothetical protein JKF63_00685 [Porcisia hertigi]
MQCIPSRGCDLTHTLTDRTLAVEQIMGGRSLLPPSPAADQLLRLLRESGHPCASPAKQGGSSDVLEWTPTSFSAANITRHCPSSGRVASSFAAAGAHSMLGEMLQFFAESMTRLFVIGVADPSVRAFPSEWERRLHAPAAASLRQHHLYELQGFSTLFMFVWGKVAASFPFSIGQGEEQALLEPAAGTTVASYTPIMSASGDALAKGPKEEQPVTHPLPPSASPSTERRTLPIHTAIEKSSNCSATCGKNMEQGRPCIPLTSATLFLPDVKASPPIVVKKQPKDNSSSAAPSRSERQPATLAVFQHSLTAQAKTQKPFLPSIPREGLVPSTAHREYATREGEWLHSTTYGAANNNAPRLHTSEQSAVGAAASHPTSSRTLSVEKAMQLSRERELQKELGVRRVRNYAAEADMRDYLHSYEANLRSVLDEDVAIEGSV